MILMMVMMMVVMSRRNVLFLASSFGSVGTRGGSVSGVRG